MSRKPQKRTERTRARLISEAKKIIAEIGYENMRVDAVVKNAKVAKGTFFAHFKDKDSLMDLIVGSEIDRCLDQIETFEPPTDVQSLINNLQPLLAAMTVERYVFDIIQRHSVADDMDNIGAIATTFTRQVLVLASWIEEGLFRDDIPPVLLAEGIQAFAIQAMALKFSAFHQDQNVTEILKTYLDAWLLEPQS